jgi:hypothetical protein
MRVTTALSGQPAGAFLCDRLLGISRSAPAFKEQKAPGELVREPSL